ncbi:MAG: T9SS type A sorting domain-containing protein [Rhodothermales bacterium]
MNRPALILPVFLLAALLVLDVAQAQVRLHALVVSDGAVAVGGTVTLRATIGQPVIGPAANASRHAGFGFWYGMPKTPTPTAVEDEPADLPRRFRLEQNYPNPFNPSTRIRYELSQTGPVRLAVYDMLGRVVKILVDELQAAGRYEVTFEAGHLPTGAYLYRIETGSMTRTHVMMLIR